MKAIVALSLLVVGCKYPDPGFDRPHDANDDAGDDATPDEMVTPPCLEPGSIDNMVELPGIEVAGFSPAEDESFAISWLPEMNLGYTDTVPLGESYSPTSNPKVIRRAHLSPDGTVVYFMGLELNNMGTRRAVRNGAFGTWQADVWSGLPDSFPGRPTADDQRMFLDNDLIPQEWARNAGTWLLVRNYRPEHFGNEAESKITSGNLSPDGNFLVYTLEGPNENGIHLRVRVNGSFDGFDGAYGRGLAGGPYRDPVLVANCTKLYVFNTQTRHVERWDVHPLP